MIGTNYSVLEIKPGGFAALCRSQKYATRGLVNGSDDGERLSVGGPRWGVLDSMPRGDIPRHFSD